MATPATSGNAGPSAPVDLDGTIGVAFIGLILSALLFGVSNAQLYVYYVQYPNEWIVYKVSAAVLWLLDGLNLVFTIHAVYYYVILNFGKYSQLDIVVWSFKAQIFSNVLIVLAVQSLYAVRLWKLNNANYRKRWYPRFLPVVIVLGTAIGIALTVKTVHLQSFSQLVDMKWMIYCSFASSVLVDTCITVAMICYLYGSKTVNNETIPILSTTNHTLTKLAVWVLSTGAATSLCSLLALIMYACLPQKLAFLAVEFLVSKLYFNSLMAFLNARNHIAEKHFNLRTIDCLQSPSLPSATLPAVSRPDAPPRPGGHMEGNYVSAFATETVEPDTAVVGEDRARIYVR